MRSIRLLLSLAVGTVLAVLTGCQSYDIVQENVFSDEDGYLVRVEYGRSDSDHVNYFKSPVNGKEMEFRSRLVVRVTLPDGDRFKAWQCMNFQRSGTMYQTDNGEWKALMNGFSCVIYRRVEESAGYVDVYRGVLCETPEREVTKDDRWHDAKRQQKNFKNKE